LGLVVHVHRDRDRRPLACSDDVRPAALRVGRTRRDARRQPRVLPGRRLRPAVRPVWRRPRCHHHGAAVLAHRVGSDAHRLGNRRHRQRVDADLRRAARDPVRAARAGQRVESVRARARDRRRRRPRRRRPRRRLVGSHRDARSRPRVDLVRGRVALQPAQARRLVRPARLDRLGAVGNARHPSVRDRPGPGRDARMGGDRRGRGPRPPRDRPWPADVPPPARGARLGEGQSRRVSAACVRPLLRLRLPRRAVAPHRDHRAGADPRRRRARLGLVRPLRRREPLPAATP